MEDNLNVFWKCNTTSIFLKMEDDINFFLKMEEDLNFVENGKWPQLKIGRQKQFFENGRQPNFFLNGRWPQFLKTEEELFF